MLADIVTSCENYTWCLQGLMLHCGVLYSQNGGSSNLGRMPDKEDNTKKPGMGLAGEMDLGNTGYCFCMGTYTGRHLISFYLLSFWCMGNTGYWFGMGTDTDRLLISFYLLSFWCILNFTST